MVTAVRSRPNHYVTLGVSPHASEEEIRNAFARMMGMFGAHPVVAATSVSAAFEVLRNPDKRRAYDRAIGLVPEPSSGHWKVAGVGWSSPGLIGTTWGPPAKREPVEMAAPVPRDPPREIEIAPAAPAPGDPPTEVAHAAPPPHDPRTEVAEAAIAPHDPPSAAEQTLPGVPRLGSFISSSLRDLAKPVTPEVTSEASTNVALQVEPQPDQPQTPSTVVARYQPVAPRNEPEIWLDGYSRQSDLRRPALIGLGAIVAAGLIGAIAGASADDRDQQPPPPKRGVTVALPVAAPPADSALTASVPAARTSQTRTPWRNRAGTRSASVEHELPAQQLLAATAGRSADDSPAEDSGLSATPPVEPTDAQSEPEAEASKVEPIGAASRPPPYR